MPSPEGVGTRLRARCFVCCGSEQTKRRFAKAIGIFFLHGRGIDFATVVENLLFWLLRLAAYCDVNVGHRL